MLAIAAPPDATQGYNGSLSLEDSKGQRGGGQSL